MLQHLSSLRASVTRLCPVFHPWVRNMSKQDRWAIYVDDNGDPKSVAFIPAVDAKHLVGIFRDNANSFPAFSGQALPLQYAGKLLDIYTDGPMARLLSSVAKIGDEERWWSDVDQLIEHASVEKKHKQIANFVLLNLPDRDSVIEPSMRASLSERLFAWEANDNDEVGEYETDTAPRPNLPVVGLAYLISRNVDIPSLTRYGMKGLASYRVHRQTIREMASCLEWITKEERRGKTWQSVPGKDKDSRDLLIIHVSGNPDVQVRLADFFGDLNEPDQDDGAYYAALCESVIRFFADGKVAHSAHSELLDLILLRKVSPGVTRVETHLQPTVEQLKQVILDWQSALNNVPFPMFPTRYMAPGQITRALRRRWICSGNRYLDTRWELSALYDIMFSRSSARVMVEAAYQSGKALLLSQSRRAYTIDHVTAVGLSLWYAGYQKEEIVESVAYRLGRFLQMADLLHKQYCRQVRDGSMPPQFIGNAHFDVCSQSPAKALAMMQSRLKVYQGYAQSRGDGLSKWTLWQLSELSTEIASRVPVTLSTEDKAQMLLGYLARTPSGDNLTGSSARNESASPTTV
jgi:hypothetical protein